MSTERAPLPEPLGYIPVVLFTAQTDSTTTIHSSSSEDGVTLGQVREIADACTHLTDNATVTVENHGEEVYLKVVQIITDTSSAVAMVAQEWKDRITAHVAAGAEWLDGQVPNWWAADFDQLDMSPRADMSTLLARVPGAERVSGNDAYRAGMVSVSGGYGYNPTREDAVNSLYNEAWRREIKTRRTADRAF